MVQSNVSEVWVSSTLQIFVQLTVLVIIIPRLSSMRNKQTLMRDTVLRGTFFSERDGYEANMISVSEGQNGATL